MNYFANEIKEKLDTIEVFEAYGLKPNRAGFINCPFHGEKTPSFKVYKGSGGFHCFGCGEHGGIIDFVMKYFGLSFKEAIEKLNDDFMLGLPVSGRIDRRKQIEISKRAFQAKKEREREQTQIRNLKDNYNLALSEFIRLDLQKNKYSPKSPDEEPNPLFAEALHDLSYAKYCLDCAETELYLYETRNSSNTRLHG